MKKIGALFSILILMMSFFGCSVETINQGAGEKVRDIEYTILSDDRIPEELQVLLEERKEEAFSMTYSDKEHMYICIGYGEQEYCGHSIVINQLFLGEYGILIDTSLLGPDAGKEKIDEKQYPYIVMKTEWMQEVPLYTK
ncbi:MAG: protease complex subunit PrcB family protein [Lachnospiraceae bacterium]